MANQVTKWQCESCQGLFDREIDANTCCIAPEMIETPDYTPLRLLAEQYMDNLINDRPKDDLEFEFFVTAMQMYYGDDVHQWIARHYPD